MRINYNKSDLITMNVTDEDKTALARTFCCNIGDFPIKYLGSLYISANSKGKTFNQ